MLKLIPKWSNNQFKNYQKHDANTFWKIKKNTPNFQISDTILEPFAWVFPGPIFSEPLGNTPWTDFDIPGAHLVRSCGLLFKTRRASSDEKEERMIRGHDGDNDMFRMNAWQWKMKRIYLLCQKVAAVKGDKNIQGGAIILLVKGKKKRKFYLVQN